MGRSAPDPLRAPAAALAALVLLMPVFAAAQAPAPPPLPPGPGEGDPGGLAAAGPVPVDPALLGLLEDRAIAGSLTTALAELRPALQELGQPLHPMWLSGDAAAIRGFLEASVDPTGVLRFGGPTAALDARMAQGILDALGEARDSRATMEDVLQDLGALLATGALPAGAETGPAAFPLPTDPPAGPAAPAAPDRPRPPGPAGGQGQDEGRGSALAALEAHVRAHPDPWRPELGPGIPAPPAPDPGPDPDLPGPRWHAALNVREVQPQFSSYEAGEEVNITVVVGLSTSTRAPVSCYMSVRYVPTRAVHFSWWVDVGPAGSVNEVRTVTSFILEPAGLPVGQYQIGAQCETVFSGDCCTTGAVRSAFLEVNGRRDDHDLTIADQDIRVRILDSTPQPNPATWRIEFTASYRARMGDCAAHTYDVRIEAQGKQAQTLSRTSTCGVEQIGPLVLTVPKGAELRVVLDPGDAVKENDESDNVAVKSFGKVQVLRVFPEWRGGYLAGMPASGPDGPPVLLALTKDSELGDEVVARVEFSRPGLGSDPIAGATTEFDDLGDGLKLFRLRRDLRTVSAGEHWVQAVAVSAHGANSQPERARLLFWELPGVLQWFSAVYRAGLGPLYTGDLGAGDPGAREIRWRLLDLDKVQFNLWNKTYRREGLGQLIPGLKSTMNASVGVSFSAGVKSTDAHWGLKGDASIQYCSPFKVRALHVFGVGSGAPGAYKDTRDGCISGSVALEGRWGDGATPVWTLAELRFTLGFTVGFKIGILGWVLSLSLSPPVAKVVRMLADLDLKMDFAVSVVLIFAEDKARELIPGTGMAFRGADIPLRITAAIEATVGAKKLMRAAAKFTMDSELRWEYRPGTGFEWKSWKGCTAGCGLTFTVELFGALKRDYPCCILIESFEVLGGPGSGPGSGPGPDPGPLSPADRDWLGPGYAAFRGGAGGVLVEQVWPGANPSVAARGGDLAVVAWSHDVPERPLGQSLDLQYAVWNGTAWRAPRAIEGDALNDESPALALGSPAEVGAAWARSKRPLGGVATLDQAAAATEVAFSRYDLALDAWSAPLLLTDDERYDKLHAIASDGAGAYLVAWVQDADGSFDTDRDDALLARWVVGGAALPPGRIATVNATQPPALALLPGGAAIAAWTEDADGDPRTLDTQVRWSLGQPGTGTWTEPRTASDPQRTAHSPALSRDATGQVSLVWVERVPAADPEAPASDAVLRSRLAEAGLALPEAGPLPGTPPAGLAAPPGLAPPPAPAWAAVGFERSEVLHTEPPEQTIAAPQILAGATAGQDILAWQGGGHAQRLRYRGLAGDAPVRDLGLDGPASRGQFALLAGLDGNPAVLAAHLRQDPAGRVHLDVPRQALGPDATLAALTVDPPNPAPGSHAAVRAVVTNRGEAPTGDFAVTFLDDGAAFADAPVASLAPGASAEVEVAWEVSGDDAAHAVRAIADQAGEVPDADRGNNAAGLTTVLPDLAVEEFWPRAGPGFVRILGTVTNGGSRSAGATVAAEVLEGGDAPGGIPPAVRLLAQAPLAPVAPGSRAVVDLRLPAGALPAGDHALRLRIAAGEDFDPANDARADVLRLGPDLAVHLEARARPGSTAADLRATVENRGNMPSPATTLEFRAGDAAAGALLAARPVPPLAPGARAEFSAPWVPAAGGGGAFAVADPAGAVPDLDRANNAAHDALAWAGLADLAAGPGSLAFEGDEVVLTAWNLGEGRAAYASATLSAGTRSGMAGLAGLAPGGAGVARMPEHRLNLSRVGPQGQVHVALDAAGRVAEASEANNLASLPLVGLRSPTHPSPFAWSAETTARLEFSAPGVFGVLGYSWVVDQAPGTEPDDAPDGAGPLAETGPLADGVHYVHLRAITAAGATGTLHYPLLVQSADHRPPATGAHLAEETVEEDGTTYVSARTWFRLEARDEAAPDGSSSASGVAATHLRIDDGPEVAYAGPFQLAGLDAGPHRITYWSTDRAGNAEAPHQLEVHLEAPLPPTLTMDALGFVADQGRWYAERNARIALAAREPGGYRTFFPPGPARVEVSLDGGPFGPSGGLVAAVQPGDASGAQHTLVARAVGATGVPGESASAAWTVDLDAPAAALPRVRWGPGGSFEVPAEGAVLAGPATFLASGAEPTSGLAGAAFYLDGALLATLPAEGAATGIAWTVDTRDWDVGNHRVRVVVRDLLGHTGSAEVGVYVLASSVAVYTDPGRNLAQLTPPADPSLPPAPAAPPLPLAAPAAPPGVSP